MRYGYLLGQYLGDGHLVVSARVPVLRIYCTNDYPGIIEECADAMRGTLARSVQRVQKKGCVGVQAYSMHWTCLFPQHGPGRNTSGRSPSRTGSGGSSTSILSRSCAACSTPTAAGW